MQILGVVLKQVLVPLIFSEKKQVFNAIVMGYWQK